MRNTPFWMFCTGLLLLVSLVLPPPRADAQRISPELEEFAEALAHPPELSVFLPATGLVVGKDCTVVAVVVNSRVQRALSVTPVPRIHPAEKLPPLTEPPTQVVAVLLWPASSDPQSATSPSPPKPQLGSPITIPHSSEGAFEVTVPGSLLHEGDYWIQAVMLVGEEEVAHSTPALVHVRSAPPATYPSTRPAP